jgi:hypothetical protein
MQTNQLTRDPIATTTTAAIHDNLFILWDTGELASYSPHRYKFSTNVTYIPLIKLSNVEEEKVLACIKTGFKFEWGNLGDTSRRLSLHRCS